MKKHDKDLEWGQTSYSYDIRDVETLQELIQKHGNSIMSALSIMIDSGLKCDSIDKLINVWIYHAERIKEGRDVVSELNNSKSMVYMMEV